MSRSVAQDIGQDVDQSDLTAAAASVTETAEVDEQATNYFDKTAATVNGFNFGLICRQCSARGKGGQCALPFAAAHAAVDPRAMLDCAISSALCFAVNEDPRKEYTCLSRTENAVRHLSHCGYQPTAVRQVFSRLHEGAKRYRSLKKRPAQSSGSAQQKFHAVPHVDKPFNTAQQKDFELLLLNATLSANLPLQWVENPQVQQMLRLLRPGIKLPARNALAGSILQRAVKLTDADCAKEIADSSPGERLTAEDRAADDRSRLLYPVCLARAFVSNIVLVLCRVLQALRRGARGGRLDNHRRGAVPRGSWCRRTPER
jgi:hypothetical protein